MLTLFMSNPLGIIAEKLRGHPCERIVKQTGNEIKLSGASVGIGDYKMDIAKFSNKIKEFYKITSVMVALDNSQYRLCTSIFKMNLEDELKDTVNRIRLQIMLAFDQLQSILGSIEQKPTDGLLKELEEWIDYMGELSKRSIDALSPPTPSTKQNIGLKKFTKSLSTESYVETPESLKQFLDKTMNFQKINKDELDEAVKFLS